MQSKQEIKIKNVVYDMHVGISTLRIYSRKQGLKTLSEAIKTLQADGQELDFEILGNMALFVLCAIQEGMRKAGKDIPDFTLDDIVDLYDDDPDELARVWENFANTMGADDKENNTAENPEQEKKQ